MNEMFNSTLKKRETLLLFLSVVINGLKCIEVDIGLNMRVRERWREDVSKLEMNQPQLRVWILLKKTSVTPQFK